jgi:EthD domain
VIRRLSIVSRRPDLDRSEFLARWTGEHAEAAARLKGLRGYVIYVPEAEDAPFDGIAVTSFDSREEAEEAFADPELAVVLARTRDDFAASVDVHFVEEHTIVEEGA